MKNNLLRPTYKKDIYSSHFAAQGSRLVYGTSGLGGVWGAVEESESVDCLLYAFGKGILSLDTSPSYSHSEKYVGKALKQWRGEKPFISTKVGRLQSATAFDAVLDYSEAGMRNSILRSLDLLGVDKVDLLFLHEPQWVPIDQVERILDTLLSFQAAGYTDRLGIGGNPSAAFRPYIKGSIFEVVSTFCRMDACSLAAFESEMAIYQQQNIAVYAASALHFSLLGNRFELFTKHPPTDNEYITALEIKNAIEVQRIAQKYGMSLPSLAQRYLFSMEEATRVVMGARNMGQIQNTLTDWEQGSLSETLFNEITEILIS